jgi:hypothetical protein
MAEPARETFLDELRDAVSPRALGLAAGVLLLQLAFILSYVGAFHSPKPHRIPIDVVGPAQTVQALNGIAERPLDARPAKNLGTARDRLLHARTAAVLVVNGTSTRDTLLVASAGGTSVSDAVSRVIEQVELAQHRSVVVDDVRTPQAKDARGLTGFYASIGWLVGGYLFAASLAMSKGARPATFRRSLWRVGAAIPYAVLSGLGGAIIVDPGLGALTGHFAAIWGIGTLLVFAAAVVTIAFQILLGVLGIGLTVLVFVVLGNPSAGGAYQASVLPPFWRAIGQALPNGAGTTAIRRVSYFHGAGAGPAIAVIAIWAAAGLIVTIGASAIMHRRRAHAA